MFEISYLDGGSSYTDKVLLMRNPWGVSFYNDSWSYADPRWNEASVREQVPLGIDPRTQYLNGYYVVPMTNFFGGKCFADFQSAHERTNDGYKIAWFDAENMDENFHNYFVTIPEKKGDLYFMVESYMYNTVPNGCIDGVFQYTDSSGTVQSLDMTHPLLYFALYDQSNPGRIIAYKYYVEQFQKPIIVKEADYSAGTQFKIVVRFLWFDSPAPDYTVSVYSRQDLTIYDNYGSVKKYYMDGQQPSGFASSSYRGMNGFDDS